ncbi:MAG: hypothetical protein JWR60_2715 [Polaromonas sp.]|nr:hypothetical protein [Polaromonas sp.]
MRRPVLLIAALTLAGFLGVRAEGIEQRSAERTPALEKWPTRPLRIVVAYPPGGVSDQVARGLAERLATQLGVPVLVENRSGAGGTLAMRMLAGSAPDGHTLGFGAASAVSMLSAQAGRNATGPDRVTPVAGVMRTPVLIVGTAALQHRTFAGMLVQAREQPGGIRWATTGEGTTGHTVLERVRRASGAAIVHVPYKGGGQQVSDAMGGHFEVLSTNVAAQQLDAIRAGRLTALAVGAPERLAVLPEVATLAQLGYADANLDSLFGLFAPPQTPPSLVSRLNDEVALALRHPSLRTKLLEANNTPFEGSALDFAGQIEREAHR